MKETERLINDPVPGIEAVPHEENLRYFSVIMDGPIQSPYEGFLVPIFCLVLRSIHFNQVASSS